MASTTLLLVVGPGRSGTSTLAGALSKLGAHVPGPYLNANESNPKGFFESAWSVAFHNRILKRGPMNLADARPEAGQVFEDAVTAKDREELAAYLAEQRGDHDLMVLKDPRLVWSVSLFQSVAAELDMDLAAMVMLRDPAEVVASRMEYYRKPSSEQAAAGYQARDLAGWVNTLATCELATRDIPRSFISYHDLLGDWRGTMGRALQDVPVQLSVPEAGEQHEIDDFIDPSLNRHQAGWPQDSAVPDDLRELTERTWGLCAKLTADAGSAEATRSELDEVRAQYARLYDIARALAHDEIVAEVAKVKRSRPAASKPGPKPAQPVRPPASRARRARSAVARRLPPTVVERLKKVRR